MPVRHLHGTRSPLRLGHAVFLVGSAVGPAACPWGCRSCELWRTQSRAPELLSFQGLCFPWTRSYFCFQKLLEDIAERAATAACVIWSVRLHRPQQIRAVCLSSPLCCSLSSGPLPFCSLPAVIKGGPGGDRIRLLLPSVGTCSAELPRATFCHCCSRDVAVPFSPQPCGRRPAPPAAPRRLSQPGSRPPAGTSSLLSNLASVGASRWPAELPGAPAPCGQPPSAPLRAPVRATTGVSGCSKVAQISGTGGSKRGGLGLGALSCCPGCTDLSLAEGLGSPGDTGREHLSAGTTQPPALPVLLVGNAAVLIPDRVRILCFCASITFKQTLSPPPPPLLVYGQHLQQALAGPTSPCQSPDGTCRLCTEHSRTHPVTPALPPTTLRSLPGLPGADRAARIWTILFLISTSGRAGETNAEMVSRTDLVQALSPSDRSPSVLVFDRPSPTGHSLCGAKADAVPRSMRIKPAMFSVYKISFSVMALAPPVETQSFSHPGTPPGTSISLRTDTLLLLTPGGGQKPSGARLGQTVQMVLASSLDGQVSTLETTGDLCGAAQPHGDDISHGACYSFAAPEDLLFSQVFGAPGKKLCDGHCPDQHATAEPPPLLCLPMG